VNDRQGLRMVVSCSAGPMSVNYRL